MPPPVIVLPEVELPVFLSAEERAELRRERRIAAKREKRRELRQLRDGAKLMLGQLIAGLPKKLQSKFERLTARIETAASRAVSSRMDVRVDLLHGSSREAASSSSSATSSSEEEDEEGAVMSNRRNTLMRQKRKNLKRQDLFGTCAIDAPVINTDNDGISQHDDYQVIAAEEMSVLDNLLEQVTIIGSGDGDTPGTLLIDHPDPDIIDIKLSRNSTPADSDYRRSLLNRASTPSDAIPISSSRVSTAASDKSNRNTLSSRGSAVSANRRTRDGISSRESQRVMSLMNLTKVMMDGSIIVNAFNIFESVSGANTLQDVSCILEASPAGPADQEGDRLSTPIFSVRVVATPRTPSTARTAPRITTPYSAVLDVSQDPQSDFEIVRIHSSAYDPSVRIQSSGYDPSVRVYSSRYDPFIRVNSSNYDLAVRRMPYAYRPIPPAGSLWGTFPEFYEDITLAQTNNASFETFPDPDPSDVMMLPPSSEEESCSALAFPSIDIKSLLVGQKFSQQSVDCRVDTLISKRKLLPRVDDRIDPFAVSPRTKKAFSSLHGLQRFDRRKHQSIASEVKKISGEDTPGESKPTPTRITQKVSPVPPPSPPPPVPSSKGLYIIAQNIQKIASAQSSRGTDERSTI